MNKNRILIIILVALLSLGLVSVAMAATSRAGEPPTAEVSFEADMPAEEKSEEQSLQDLELLYDSRRITKEEYLQAVEGLGQPESCSPDAIWPGPDGFGYMGEDVTYSWVDISGTGTAVYLNCDDCNAGPFPVGFTFPFYGVDYTEFYIEANGLIEFGPVENDFSSDCPLPNSNGAENFLAPHWDDLYSGNNNAPVYYQYFPTCPYGSGECIVVEYYDFYHLDGDWAGTWEAIFYPNGDIVYQYFQMGPQQGEFSTTGIEGLDIAGDHGLTYACNSQGSIYDNLAIRIFLPPPSPKFYDSYKEAWPPKVEAGEVVNYTIVINNSGDLPALDAAMTDTLPLGTEFISGTLSCSSGDCWFDDIDNTVYWTGTVGLPAPPPVGWKPDLPQGALYDPLMAYEDISTVVDGPGPLAGPLSPFNWPTAVLYDNGPLVTHPGGGGGGADASRLQTTLLMNTLGFGHQYPLGYRIADDFEITDPGGWNIDQIIFFAYQTNAPTDPSTITGVYYQIWDGPPDDPASNVVFGDLVTNRLVDTVWSNIYRDSETSPGATNRPIMADTASAGVWLPPGTYWLDWMTDGSLTSGPWAPPITILGQTTTGNALQYTTAWAPANDSGTLTQQGMPFIIEGQLATPSTITVTFQVQTTGEACGTIVNEVLITDPEAEPVWVAAEHEVWDNVLLHEDFEGAFPPADWTVVDNIGSGAPGSVFTNTTGRPNLTGGSGLFAIVDSDFAGPGIPVDTELWLPPLDFPICSNNLLVFKSDYFNLGDTADVDFSMDGGATWDNLLRWTTSVPGPHTQYLPLPPEVSGQSGVLVRFHYYNANWAWWWEIDDVQVVGCAKEGVFLEPEYQFDLSTAGEVVSYSLTIENCTYMTDTFSLDVGDFDYPTWFDQTEFHDMGHGDKSGATAYVQSWCEADGPGMSELIASGWTSGYTDTAWVENLAIQGAWFWNPENADMGTMPDTYWGSGDGIVMSDTVPLFWNTGGVDNTGAAVGQSWYFDWSTGAWTDGGVMPTALYRTEGDVQNNEFYNVGGSTGGFAPTDWNQHEAGGWSYAAPAPAVSMDEVVEPWPAAYGGNDHTYLVGGYPGINTAYEYDPVADAWTTLSSHISATINYPVDGCFGWTDGSGGADPVIIQFPDTSSAQPNLLVYHVASDTWEEWPAPTGFPAGIWAHDVANDYDRNLCYITGGASVPGGGDLTSFYIYDPATNTVTQGPDFDSPRDFHSSWYYNDMLCIAGGINAGGVFLDSTQCAVYVEADVEPDMVLDAPSLHAYQFPDTVTYQYMTLANVGTCPAEWTLGEWPTGVMSGMSTPFFPAGAKQLGPMPEDVSLTLESPVSEVIQAPSLPANPEAVLWDQPISAVNTGAYAAQDFVAFNDFDIFRADDFTNAETWMIDTIFVPGNLWNGGTTLTNAVSLHWEIYADAHGQPDGDPWSGMPVWSLTLSPTDTHVTLSTGVGGLPSDTTLALDDPIILPPGTWWFNFYPTIDFSMGYGQYGVHVSDTTNGYSAHTINPGGAFGFGTEWTPFDMLYPGIQSDHAFRLEGEVYDIPWLSEDPTMGYVVSGDTFTVELAYDSAGLMLGDYFGDLMLFSNDPDAITTTLPVTLTVFENADLSLSKTDDPDPVYTSATLTYTLVVVNDGPHTAVNVMLTDTLPAGVTFVTASHIGCAEDGGVVTCDLGDLASSEGITSSITVLAPETAGTITNMAEVSSDTDDPDTTDNAASEDTDVLVSGYWIYLPMVTRN